MMSLLALGWGVLVATPVAALARSTGVARRGRGLVARPRARRRRIARLRSRLVNVPGIASVVAVVTAPRRRRAARRRDDVLAAQVALAVDLVGVGVAAGCTPFLAVESAARWAPPLAAAPLTAIVRACAVGESFDDALRAESAKVPALRGLADVLRTSARLGSPVGPALTRLANELRADLRRRAETRARTVPVRLCFPLVACILPAFALLTVVPVVLDGLHA